VRPPGLARQDWEILARTAEALGAWDVSAPAPEEVAALCEEPQGVEAAARGDRRDLRVAGRAVWREVTPHRYRGLGLAECSEGLARLAPEDTLLISPEDARELGVGDGDSLAVEAGATSRTYPVVIDRRMAPSIIRLLAGVR
jgi:anaerobic selenocysteine-containing dehydrogenase